MPVTIYSHGFPSIRWGSAFMMESLATHGFISIAPDHRYGTVFDVDVDKHPNHILSRPDDIIESFDWLVSQNNINGDLFNCIVPEEGYSMIGQSTGGYTSMMISGAKILSSDLELGCIDNDSDFTEINCAILSIFDQNVDLDTPRDSQEALCRLSGDSQEILRGSQCLQGLERALEALD